MWHRSWLDTVKQVEQRGVCLYGAGFWGKIACRLFRKMGCEPLGYCDDNLEKQDTEYLGLPVYSLESAVKQYPEAVYIVCVDVTKKAGTWNRADFNRMLRRLKEFGVYDSNSELRVIMYIFLLDTGYPENVSGNHEFLKCNTESCIEADCLDNLLILNHMSNSGSYYLEQLLDGHPNILCLPYGGETFWTVYEKRLQYLEGEELLIEMMAQMLGYFHSEFEDLYCVREHKFEEYCVDANGNFIKEVLIEPSIFMEYLRWQFRGNMRLRSFGHMLKLYVAAYNNCLEKRKQKDTDSWIFFQMHKPGIDVSELDTYFDGSEFSHIENLVVIREPVQQCHSWIRRVAMKQKRNTLLGTDSVFYFVLRSELGLMLEKRAGYDNVKVVRFEDLKYQSEGIMKGLCKWLNIPCLDILMSTTLNGREIYFPTYTKDGVKYITGNDTTAVNQKDFSEVLTVWDEARLNIIYAKFKQAYGYESDVPDFTEHNREFLENLLQQDFKFATIVQEVIEKYGSEEENYDVNEFVKELYLDYMLSYQKDTEYYDYIKPEKE